MRGFSALQRAEIAEMPRNSASARTETTGGFSALQRAEIAEIVPVTLTRAITPAGFSALQRAEIAEMSLVVNDQKIQRRVFQCSSTSRNC